ncbi:MAG: hypothetical protein HUJ25_00340 [Crocinitomicaceae bacterium]|nr:hypothetical protein [Crocinitomicaceae bacterium]
MNYFYIALFAAIFTLTACEKENIQIKANNNEEKFSQVDCSWTWDLIAGQNQNAGTLSISNDNNFIYVTFNTSGQALIYETHVYVGEMSGLPTNGGGNPQIGQFPYSDTHNGVSTFTITVPIDPNLNCFVVAAHASVGMLDEEGNVSHYETAWAGDCEINSSGGSWALYAKYCLQDCENDDLPDPDSDIPDSKI